jgi:hypothetical protein
MTAQSAANRPQGVSGPRPRVSFGRCRRPSPHPVRRTREHQQARFSLVTVGRRGLTLNAGRTANSFFVVVGLDLGESSSPRQCKWAARRGCRTASSLVSGRLGRRLFGCDGPNRLTVDDQRHAICLSRKRQGRLLFRRSRRRVVDDKRRQDVGLCADFPTEEEISARVRDILPRALDRAHVGRLLAARGGRAPRSRRTKTSETPIVGREGTRLGGGHNPRASRAAATAIDLLHDNYVVCNRM